MRVLAVVSTVALARADITDETQLLQHVTKKQKQNMTAQVSRHGFTKETETQFGEYECPNYHYPSGEDSFNGWAKCGDIIQDDPSNSHCSKSSSGWYRACAGACGRTYTTPGAFKEQCKGEGSAADDVWPACWCTQADKEERKKCYEDCATSGGMEPQYECPNYHYPSGEGSYNGWAKCGDIIQDDPSNSHCSKSSSGWYQKCAGACGRTFTMSDTLTDNIRDQCKGDGNAPQDHEPACFCAQEDKAVRKECYEECAATNNMVAVACPNYHYPSGEHSFNGWAKCGDIIQDDPSNSHCSKSSSAWYRACAGACGRTYIPGFGDMRDQCAGEGTPGEDHWHACFCTQEDKAERKECYEECASR